jgi:hypothetical protein
VVDPVGDTYRRQMNRQLTAQESRHKLARDVVCHGKHGTIHQAYRGGMEDQLGALSQVLNAVVAQLKAGGHEIREEDIARLSPLKHRNLNLLGRYSFTASAPGALRPLRDADAPGWTRTTTNRRPTEAGLSAGGTNAASYCSTVQGSTTQASRNQSLQRYTSTQTDN